MLFAAEVDAWRWQPHPEVWLLIAGVVVLALYAVRVIGPKVVPAGEPVVRTRQKAFFVAAVALLWVASDWPLHDISEDYLYSAHMVQHLLITLVVPALLLLATPTWLARLILGHGALGRWVRFGSRPLVAGVLFNVVVALSHWNTLVNASVESGPLHYSVHLVVFTAALLMWMPVCGPLPELRMSLPGRMLYLFLMSIIPTIPAAWLTFAEGVVYDAYDTPARLWGIGVVDDQQAAGLIMKLAAGMYLWTIITVLFFKWAAQEERAGHEQPRRAPTAASVSSLTWEDVEREFERLGPAPTEPETSPPAPEVSPPDSG